jgi:hypothetical protein
VSQLGHLLPGLRRCKAHVGAGVESLSGAVSALARELSAVEVGLGGGRGARAAARVCWGRPRAPLSPAPAAAWGAGRAGPRRPAGWPARGVLSRVCAARGARPAPSPQHLELHLGEGCRVALETGLEFSELRCGRGEG